MVEPSSFTDTVTPSNFSPVGDEITPLSKWSAAWRPGATIKPAAMASNRLRRFLIELLLLLDGCALAGLHSQPLMLLDGCALAGLHSQPLMTEILGRVLVRAPSADMR